MKNLSLWVLGSFIAFFGAIAPSAHALPAFAIKEKFTCNVCHADGSAPHLTKFGYLYRRAAFHIPETLGNRTADDAAMRLTEHFAVGTNVDYEFITTKDPGGTKANLTNNDINVREVELFPIVGGYFGNFGVWTEVDASPGVPGNRNQVTLEGTTTAQGGGVGLNQADLRYAVGTADAFFNFRAGLMAMEGFGASDQWIDDGNIPLFDQLTAQLNEDTLALPLGAMEVPRFGAEFGGNYQDSHLTLGVYNTFDGTNGLAGQTQSTLAAGLTNPDAKGARDFKAQLDQFLPNSAITASYYNGKISLLDPTNTVTWLNKYDTWRLYGTYFLFDNLIEAKAGAAYGTWQYVNPGSGVVAGKFHNDGFFVGATAYPFTHLTVSARGDYYRYNLNAKQKALGIALMVSLPFQNNVFVFHYNNTGSDIEGVTNDFRAEWRFLL